MTSLPPIRYRKYINTISINHRIGIDRRLAGDIHGEYARFEVTANMSEQSRAKAMTYVREDKEVEMTIGDTTAEIGEVEPIRVDTWAEFPMVVPAGKAGRVIPLTPAW